MNLLARQYIIYSIYIIYSRQYNSIVSYKMGRDCIVRGKIELEPKARKSPNTLSHLKSFQISV